MRHFPRLNRVACGILGRWHSSVLTLLAQKPGTSGKISDAVRRELSIARPSHPICVVSQRLCVGRRLASQLTCAGKDHLLRVEPLIIVRRYKYARLVTLAFIRRAPVPGIRHESCEQPTLFSMLDQ
jgi:hypothetical protein